MKKSNIFVLGVIASITVLIAFATFANHRPADSDTAGSGGRQVSTMEIPF